MFIIDASTTPENLKTHLLSTRPLVLKPDFPPTPISVTSAVKLIKTTIKKQQNILIYGDYDVDGVCSATLLWQAIYPQNRNTLPFVPDRHLDGYGFNFNSYKRFIAEKNFTPDLVITVDNGIVATKEIRKLKKTGLKIIIVDHHLPSPDLPQVNAIVHSPEVCATALAWFIAKEIDPNSDLGLVALATVADCLPLTGVNRALVVHGLKILKLNPSPGIRQLAKSAGVNLATLSAYDLGFILAPRINAVGRLTNPTDALRLLCSQSLPQAGKYTEVLNQQNQDRQVLQKESFELAKTLIKSKNKLIFISEPSFHQGIIGLIAGRLTEKYYLPSIVVSPDGDTAKGSCRSIPELNIIDALRQFSDLFVDLGGHAQAAGFTITTANIPKLEKKLVALVNKTLKDLVKPATSVDAQMLPSGATLANCKIIKEFEPFGIGNPEPLFLFKDLEIKSIRVLGQTGDHLKLKFDTGLDAIGFKQGSLATKLKVGDAITFIASLSSNTWNSLTTPQLIIKEII
ncbi:MAG: single-stranded-DNA-specific exonuclease RecJ [Candidatus Shapirobacteria bacterium]